MIGKLKGIIDSIEAGHLLVDVSGVCYLVHCSAKTLSQVQIKDSVELFVETCVREDQIILYGFMTKQEKECFLELVTVKGIGPKIALQILGKLTPEQVCIAVNMKDRNVLSGISGIGPKVIDRIFAELKDRAFISNFEQCSLDANNKANEVKTIRDDAISVLVNLGINRSEAFTTVSDIISQFPQYNLNEIVKAALGKMTVR